MGKVEGVNKGREGGGEGENGEDLEENWREKED